MNELTTIAMTELQAALAADEIRLGYEPKMSLATNEIVGVEAVLRWDLPAQQVPRVLATTNPRTPGTDKVEAQLLDLLEQARRASDSVLQQAEQLTTRQVEVIRRLLAGERVPRIARNLYVSPSTIRNHLSAIYRHFDVHSQDELVHLLSERSRGAETPASYRGTSSA